MEKRDNKKYRFIIIFSVFLILEIALIIFLFSFFSSPVVGYSNETVRVQTLLNVINVAPEVLTVVITNASNSYTNMNITPNPGTFKNVYCNGIVRDLDNSTYLSNVTAYLFQNSTSVFAGDDNNTHYTNSTCFMNTTVYNPTYGDDANGNYTANYSCLFIVQYYANPGYWNCTVTTANILNLNTTNTNVSGINELMAVTLPPTLNYGNVNSTYVSNENITNVSNAGNVMINLSLQGYSVYIGDGNAMNCSRGSVRNISIMYEKYNLTESNPSVSSLTQLETLYANLTSASVIKAFSLNYRQNDVYDDAINATYWRIYVPAGAAGTCSGNIVFGATKAAGSY